VFPGIYWGDGSDAAILTIFADGRARGR